VTVRRCSRSAGGDVDVGELDGKGWTASSAVERQRSGGGGSARLGRGRRRATGGERGDAARQVDG
jgi:hypothetical protein